MKNWGNPPSISPPSELSFFHAGTLGTPKLTFGAKRVETGKTIGGIEMEHFDGEVMLAATIGEVARYETDGLIRVLFDSFSHPAPAGTRSTAMSPMGIREIIFQAEPYQIDIQVEAQAEHNRLVVTGQLLDVSHPERVGLDVPIIFSGPRGTVVQTVTNQFGEFRVELENSGDLELSLIVPRGKPIVILLRGALKPSSGARQ